VTALIGAVAALLARAETPILWQGLIGKALPFSAGAVLLGLGCAAALLLNAYLAARVLVAAETVCILVAWGVAQWPYLIVPDVTVQNAASPASILGPLLIASLLGLAVLLPSLWYLLSTVKRRATASTAGGAPAGATTTVASFVSSFESAGASPLPRHDDTR
jgi:cytochrome d ubiquinol oxidase subunit II